MQYKSPPGEASFKAYEQRLKRPVPINSVLELPGVNLIPFLVALAYVAIYSYMNEL